MKNKSTPEGVFLVKRRMTPRRIELPFGWRPTHLNTGRSLRSRSIDHPAQYRHCLRGLSALDIIIERLKNMDHKGVITIWPEPAAIRLPLIIISEINQIGRRSIKCLTGFRFLYPYFRIALDCAFQPMQLSHIGEIIS